MADDTLWISEHRAGSFGRRVLAGGPVSSVCHSSPDGGRLAATPDDLWLVDAGAPVVSRASADDGSVTDRFFVPGPSGGQIAVDGVEGWVASGEYLVRFDADAGWSTD